MTAKARTVYRCAQCGATAAKWAGQCPSCSEWNSLVEEIAAAKTKTAPRRNGVRATTLGTVDRAATARNATGIAELDFVLGGGLVPGSMVLVGGEPGIGKSTLLLQAAVELNNRGHGTLYVSAEESPQQVKLRADRLERPADDVAMLGETSLEQILAVAERERPAVLIVDSIQTVSTDALEGAPGSVGQVRECAARLMRFAKDESISVFVVGHVTKDGGIAGPKTLEHVVDTVLYFEGEGSADHRVLRATKNRFGSVDEIGVFRMTEHGLVAVDSPSALFLGDRDARPAGSAVTALMEGTRPLLVEVQALAAKAGFGTPQRVSTGFDPRRLALLLAVLDKRAGLGFSQTDVFVNVVGGLRLGEPAGDLAIAAALASSVYERPVPTGAVFIGEIGLGGEIRGVNRLDRRLAEAEQLGFTTAFVAERSASNGRSRGALRTHAAADVVTLFRHLFRGSG
ncbi:MAG TPA: DNA repair protein RadA [Gemmatimonadaceae bacterium]|nr:DNA repair protein RadA [Gemmatimonadaceae bacterium]